MTDPPLEVLFTVAVTDACAGHCSNARQDCGETGSDCGGSCPACPPADQATLQGHTLPGSLLCGASASATVTFKNSGTSTWTPGDYQLGYAGAFAHPLVPSGGQPRVPLPGAAAVPPGASVTFDVPLTAPGTPGTHSVGFRMLHGTTAFGDVAVRTVAVAAGCGLTGSSFPQGVPDSDFVAAATSFADTDPQVDSAVNAAMVSLTGCGVQSSCPLTAYAGATPEQKCQSWFAAVTQKLRADGYSAGLHEVGSTDEIAVSNTGCRGKWYGYHVCFYGGPSVVWNPGARRGWWQISPSRCP